MDITLAQIQQMIDSSITKNELYNQMNLSPIATHAHTPSGDGSPINPADLINAQLYFAVKQTTLTNAQILALHTTPITLIPAIGNTASATNLNSVIIVDGITAKNYFTGTAYTGANNLEFRYTGAAGAKVTADLANTFINAVSNTYAHVAGIITAFTPVFNSPIVVVVPTANPGAGTGNIVISVKYRVITL